MSSNEWMRDPENQAVVRHWLQTYTRQELIVAHQTLLDIADGKAKPPQSLIQLIGR